MSFVGSTLPQAATQAVQSQVPQSARTTSPAQVSGQTAVANTPAAVVSLSSQGKSRSVSSGSNKYVDSSFESNATKKQDKAKEAAKKEDINVSA